MNPLPISPQLLETPFVSSWFARARPGDVFDPDPARRSAAWAHWALISLTELTGHASRPYTALKLPGRFYSPPRRQSETQPNPAFPHLEISTRIFNTPDPQFPDRLAQAGNALQFPAWNIPEVLAVKRALLVRDAPDISEFLEVIAPRRAALIDAITPLERAAAEKWSTIEELQIANPDELSATATEIFTTAEIAEYLPVATELALTVQFESQLAEKAGRYASRRVGVWTITSQTDPNFKLGVLTPRLTRSSLFTDPLFQAPTEAAAALLIRGLLLRRILDRHLGAKLRTRVANPTPSFQSGTGLRAIVSRIGSPSPEASIPSAIHFLHTYPNAELAWEALNAWATTPIGPEKTQRAVLTISQEAHAHAHRAASRALRRAEDPAREDIDVLLPLAWDHKRRVVRVTFARPTDPNPNT